MEDQDGEWSESSGVSILEHIGLNILPQTKVKASHGGEAGVSGSYCREYLTHGADVLMHAGLLPLLKPRSKYF